jgi:hypothetical protein
VVIGRHQNPWTEVNLPYLRKASINLARRNRLVKRLKTSLMLRPTVWVLSSGGGTVYHDLGNINCTFFMSRSEYDRRKNLGIVCAAIKKISNLNILINSRDDIVLDETLKVKSFIEHGLIHVANKRIFHFRFRVLLQSLAIQKLIITVQFLWMSTMAISEIASTQKL